MNTLAQTQTVTHIYAQVHTPHTDNHTQTHPLSWAGAEGSSACSGDPAPHASGPWLPRALPTPLQALRACPGPHPPVRSVPMPTTKAPATGLAARLSLHTPQACSPRPLIQAMPGDPPPGPSIAKVLSHLPNLPGPPTRPPAPLAAPRVLPAPSDGTPQSCLQSSGAAQGHQGHSRHPEPPLPSTATAGSPSPLILAGQLPDRAQPCEDPTLGSGSSEEGGEEGPALWPSLAASHPPGGEPAGPGQVLQCSPGPGLGRGEPVGASGACVNSDLGEGQAAGRWACHLHRTSSRPPFWASRLDRAPSLLLPPAATCLALPWDRPLA